MKKIALLLSFILCVSANAYSNVQTLADNTEPEIKITQIPLHVITAKQPRSVVDIPIIDCYYFNGVLYVCCDRYYEIIDVYVTCISTSEQYSASFGEYNQTLQLSIPYVPGDYYLEVEIDSMILCGYYSI